MLETLTPVPPPPTLEPADAADDRVHRHGGLQPAVAAPGLQRGVLHHPWEVPDEEIGATGDEQRAEAPGELVAVGAGVGTFAAYACVLAALQLASAASVTLRPAASRSRTLRLNSGG